MPIRLTNLIAQFALVFCLVAGSALGEARSPLAGHDGALAAGLEQAGGGGHDDHSREAGDAPCAAASHHHCSLALAVEAPGMGLTQGLRDGGFLALSAPAMASLSRAPPTQPPSA